MTKKGKNLQGKGQKQFYPAVYRNTGDSVEKTDDSLTFQQLIRVAFSPKAYTKSHSSYLPLGRDEYFLRIIPKP
ncbi:hypothetical protein PMI23_04638 [Pseudomonas sp. GM24]|jgi:hypothetical protein|nr:hypothetical protein PMI19_00596 [Pseudomonas sp. GM16]EJM30777.1 hypothetical protein PMI23_04638 [Pseudomonas sp. GM24]